MSQLSNKIQILKKAKITRREGVDIKLIGSILRIKAV